MVKLVVVGHLAINDTYTRYGHSLTWGGAGYHVAWAAAQFMPAGSVGLVSMCGSDFNLSGLTKAGVNVGGVIVDRNRKSDKFEIHEYDQGRTFECKGNINRKVTLDTLPEDYLRAKWVHLATSPPSQQLLWVQSFRKLYQPARGLSSDTFEIFAKRYPSKVVDVFSQTDLFFVNMSEWELLQDNMNPRLKKVLRVIKKGSLGAELLYKNKKSVKIETPKVNRVVDTTGAGELLAGVFLALRTRGLRNKESLENACKVSTWSIKDFGVEHLLDNQEFIALKSSINNL